MDYDKLIARWRNLANRWENGEQLLLDGTVRIEDELRIGATAIETLCVDLALVTAERDAAIERAKRALAMMWFAYVNSDKEFPHTYEIEALEEAERILGPWAECMPKYLRRREG